MKNIKEDEKLNTLNHSCAHLLAHAIKHLYPKALFWVGPVIENGFYYETETSRITIGYATSVEDSYNIKGIPFEDITTIFFGISS